MKIKFEIAQNGYKSDIQQAREDGAYHEWIDAKFGSRIRDLISADFTMLIDDPESGGRSFTVDFVYEDDGREFLKHFGGRIIE